jgi:ribosomal protein L11
MDEYDKEILQINRESNDIEKKVDVRIQVTTQEANKARFELHLQKTSSLLD